MSDEWKTIKGEAAELFKAGKFLEAAEKYQASLRELEKVVGEEPDEFKAEERKELAILHTNTAHMFLSRAKEICPDFDPEKVPPDVRSLAMKANASAGTAVALSPFYSKGLVRRGQALLWLSSAQPRAKEAVTCFERALHCRDFPKAMEAEVTKWKQYGQSRFDEETPMPDGCVVQ
jgi:tetratricopeptide (TPR) repeat protein